MRVMVDKPKVIGPFSAVLRGLRSATKAFSKKLSPFGRGRKAADLLGFGFVFAQSQAAKSMLLRLSLAKTPKSLAAERLQFFLKRFTAYQLSQFLRPA